MEELTGVLLEPHELPAFASAVEQGMSRANLERPAQYFEHLESAGGRQERVYLLDQVVNNETYFFREPQHFEAVRRSLLDSYGGGGVRLLSAGCSTGEEPYSLTMEMLELEQRLPGLDFEVVAVDISHGALDLARRGIFRSNSFRNDLARGRRNTWFEATGDGAYKLADRVMERVEFHCLNLNASHSLKQTLGVMDVIFFRNVLIYLSPAARTRACCNLLSLLRESGSLFVGTSEIPPLELDTLASQYVDGVFYWKKQAPGREGARDAAALGEQPHRAPSPASQRRREPIGRRAPQSERVAVTPLPEEPVSDRSPTRQPEPEVTPAHVEAWYEEALARVAQDRAEEALDLLGRILDRVSDHVGACRLMAELCLDRADFEDALRLTDRVIQMRASLAWPHVLRGRICQHQGDMTRAQKELRTAIYYQPDHWPAHYYLAEVHKVQGEISRAVQAYRNALRSLSKTDPGTGPDINLIGYSAGDIAATCETNIRALSEGREVGA